MKMVLIIALILTLVLLLLLSPNSSALNKFQTYYLGFVGALNLTREAIKDKSEELFPKPHSSLLIGMVFGSKGDLPPKFKENLINTGTIHIVVVSGYNVTILCLLLNSVLSSLFIKVNKLASYVMIQLIILCYVILVGGGAPVLRAFIMSALVMFGKIFGRQRTPLVILLISAVVIYVLRRSTINDLSFQLSYLATLGLILFENKFRIFFNKLLFKANSFLLTFMDFFIAGFSSTLAVMVLVWPLISLKFGRISIISPLVNSLVLWVVPLTMVLGSILLVISVFLPAVARFLAWFVFIFLDFFVIVVNFFGNLKISSVTFQISAPTLIIYYLLLGVLLIKTKGGRKGSQFRQDSIPYRPSDSRVQNDEGVNPE